MKNTLFLLLLLSFFIAKAQKKPFYAIVNYTYQINQSEYTGNYETNSVLKLNTKESLYEIDHTNSFVPEEKAENIFNVASVENEFVYKNFPKNIMYYSAVIEFKSFDIKGNLTIMDWTLNKNKKVILGYTCQEATTKYGGRTYKAYFTDEIPISNGPWRFQGLPGLILEVSSTENVFNLRATDIKVKTEPLKIKNPFEGKKTMTWPDFLTLYQKKYDEVLRNSIKNGYSTQELPKKGVVEYIKD